MKKIKAIVITAFVFLQLQPLLAQVNELPWQPQDRKDAKPLAYEYQREADVFWSKNIWRIVDVRQKMNMPFAYPQKPLIQVLHEAAMKGEIKVYDAAAVDADQFKQVLPVGDVARIGTIDDTLPQLDPQNPDMEVMVPRHIKLEWERIKKYRIKEVWFFDSKTSTMQTRIIGIAPVMEDYDANGTYRGDMTMYWIYYPDLRNMLAKCEVYGPQNDAKRYSWDDLFEMRKFESYIYKESNIYDRNIQEYATAVDAQLESDRIKQQIFEKEHDMWEY